MDTACGCSTVVLVGCTCPATTVGTVILRALDRVREEGTRLLRSIAQVSARKASRGVQPATGFSLSGGVLTMLRLLFSYGPRSLFKNKCLNFGPCVFKRKVQCHVPTACKGVRGARQKQNCFRKARRSLRQPYELYLSTVPAIIDRHAVPGNHRPLP